MIDYTLVVGLDSKHYQQLCWTWPTWRRFKPGLLENPMLIFRERNVPEEMIRASIDHPDLRIVDWPPEGVKYKGDWESKWYNPQRGKMLAGFVHIPAQFVQTPYWLKLDTDVVAEGGHEDWIDEEWFVDGPAIVAHRWGYTKPPNQMVLLDRWVEENPSLLPWLSNQPPLNMPPKSDANSLPHDRITSWCGFFHTGFTKWASTIAERTCGKGQLPVPSQDGYMWYLAKRGGEGIRRTMMKKRGWQQWNKEADIKAASEKVMDTPQN